MFLNAENFGDDLKYINTFMEVAEDGIIEYRDNTGTIHNHTLLFQEIPSCGDSGYTLDACKRLAEEYVQDVIDARCKHDSYKMLAQLFVRGDSQLKIL